MAQVPSARARARLPGAAGVVAAVLAASCCLLPLALIATGVAGAGLMMTMMRYEWFTLPLGVFGLAGAYAFYFREQRRCDTAGCRLVGERATKTMLGVATAVVAVAFAAEALSLLDGGYPAAFVEHRTQAVTVINTTWFRVNPRSPFGCCSFRSSDEVPHRLLEEDRRCQ